MVDLVGQGLPISEMTIVDYSDDLLIPVVDLTQPPGYQNEAILASSLSTATGVRSFNGRNGSVTLQASDLAAIFNAAITTWFNSLPLSQQSTPGWWNNQGIPYFS